jgi:single-strand DNA-binding protein
MGFNYNHTTLVGRVVKDAEKRQIKENVAKTTFTLAVNRSYRKDDGTQDTDFIPISMWGKMGEIGFQILQKGVPVLVWGKIQVRNYEKDNERKWATEVVADNFQILDKLPQKSEE